MSSSVSTINDVELAPFQAVVFYGVASGTNSGLRYATVHDVTSGPNGHAMSPGRAMTKPALRRIAEMCAKARKRQVQILPGCVLYASDDVLVWWSAPCVRLCYFDIDWHMDAPGRSDLQGVNANLPMPGLIWAMRTEGADGTSRSCKVWAYRGSERPTNATALFRAPLLNLDEDGGVCWGSARVPQGQTYDDIPLWEEAFFSSTFSHYNKTSPFKGCTDYSALAAMVANPPSVFDEELLIPMGSTLLDAIIRMEGGRI